MGRFWAFGRVGVIDIDVVIKADMQPWGVVYECDLPDGVSCQSKTVARVNVESCGESSADVMVSGSKAYIRNRDNETYGWSGNGFGITGQVVFPLA